MRIVTERLVLRALDPDRDLRALHEIGQDPRVARRMLSIPADWTLAQAAAFLDRSRWRSRIGFRLAIGLRGAEERLIGTVGIGGDPVSGSGRWASAAIPYRSRSSSIRRSGAGAMRPKP